MIEIISPSSKFTDTYKKKELYEKSGVKEYWLVDPGMKSIEVFIPGESGKYELYSESFLEGEENQKLLKSSLLKELQLNLEEIFEG